MSLLQLENIKKIYTEEANAAIGLNNINLSFDRGEFVAIVGSSGSGKSTLLNVISGVDTYEEGELFFMGKPTSHYSTEEWAKYRENNIAFIFQNYNIIECITAVQNVELAIFDKYEKQERRKQAMKFLKKVGMSKYADQKCAFLSGGQKQRVAIARALAKDTEIILADEPTGNLDSQNAKEIVSLLKEVSENKLIIVVTHNPAEFEECATRVVGIREGMVYKDQKFREVTEISEVHKAACIIKNSGRKTLRKGFEIGNLLFKSRPRMSFYSCFIITLIGLIIQILSGFLCMKINRSNIVENYIFRQSDNRVIVHKKDDTAFSKEEIEELNNLCNPMQYELADYIYDSGNEIEWQQFVADSEMFEEYNAKYQGDIPLCLGRSHDIGSTDVGKYPTAANECLLYVPYALKNYFGSDEILMKSINRNGLDYKVVGIKYYLDNKKHGQMLLTNEGFKIHAIISRAKGEVFADATYSEGEEKKAMKNVAVRYSFDVEEGKLYIQTEGEKLITADKTRIYYKDTNNKIADITEIKKENVIFNSSDLFFYENGTIVINPNTIIEKLNEIEEDNCFQCSLFFDEGINSDEMVEKINSEKYFAVTTDAMVRRNTFDTPPEVSMIVFFILVETAIVLVMGLFLRVFISVSLNKYKEDYLLMLLCGVNRKIVKISIYVRFLLPLLCMIPVMALFMLFGYRIVSINRDMLFMPIWFLILEVVLIVALIYFSANRYVKKLDGKSLNQAMRWSE